MYGEIYNEINSKMTDLFGKDMIGKNTANNDDLSATQAKEWIDFLKANKVDASAYALGNAKVASQSLNNIAYDGVKNVEKDAKSFENINKESIATIAPMSGNITDYQVDKTGGSVSKFDFGADGAKSVEMTIEGKTYIYDFATGDIANKLDGSIVSDDSSNLSLTTEKGGKLEIDMSSGEYKYTPATTELDAKASIKIDYAISDRDGDTQKYSTTLSLDGGVTKAVSSDTLDGETLIGSAEKYDTMVVKSESIDFTQISNLNTKVESLDRIDLGHGDTGKTITLNAKDVINMTDSIDTILKIEGDDKDTIKGDWKVSADQSKADEGYTAYESVTDQGQTIYIQIDQDIKTDFN